MLKMMNINDDAFFTEALRKRGKNEPCWCLSGIKYKKCHWERENKDKFEIGRVLNVNYKLFNVKRCMHPDTENCSGTRIRSHTIQRNGSLKKIIDSKNNVLRMSRDIFNIDEPEEIGWKKASTFYGFCENHDGTMFSVLENHVFEADEEQCFLLYYRALCYELYNKEALVEILKFQKNVIDNGFPLRRQIEIQYSINHSISEFERTVQELQNEKAEADSYLIQRDFSNYSHLVIHFSGSLDLSSSSHFHLAYDLQGNKIYSLSDINTLGEGASFSIIDVDENRGAITISWNKSYKHVQTFIEDLLGNNCDVLLNKIHQLMFAQSENVFFSTYWWKQLSKNEKDFIKHLYYNTDENYGLELQPDFKVHRWSLEAIDKVNF